MTALPKTPIKGDAETRRFLEALRQYLTTVGRDAITVANLRDPAFWRAQSIVVPQTSINVDAETPTIPVGLTTNGLFQNIILEWEIPTYNGHSLTRIYRSETNLFETAVVIANATAKIYSDPVGPGASYYYWIANVNSNGLESAPNQVQGTLGQTLQDTEYVLGLLNESITEEQLYSSLVDRINLIDAASSVAGSVNARLQQEASNRAAAILSEASARSNADADLQTQINTIVAATTGDLGDVLAAVQEEQTARTNADAAEAAARETLATQIRGDYTGGDVAQLTTGLLYSERVARVSGDAAEATARQALASTVTNNYNTLNAAITAEQTTRASADTALSQSITSLTSTVNANTAAIQNEATTRANADSALSQSITTLTSTVNSNAAAIQSEATTRANADSALSQSITTLQASVNSNTVAIQNEATARAEADGSLSAQYTVKIDSNGYVSGFGLASTANNANPFSSFIVRADRFTIASPSGPGITPKTPFVVTTTPTVENGVTIQPGVYIDSAVIKDASITSAKIGDLVADKITAGRLKVALGLDGDLNVGTGRIVFDTGVYMKVQGLGFGSENQFIEWFGPKVASLALCTEANAVTYIKTNGDAYFGGNLSAGTITNSGRTTLSTQTEFIVGPFGSAGDVVTVVAVGAGSYVLATSTNQFLNDETPPPDPYTSARQTWRGTWVVERSLDGSSWTQIATFTKDAVSESRVVRNGTIYLAPGEPEPAFSWQHYVSITDTRTTSVVFGSTTDARIRIRRTAFYRLSDNFSALFSSVAQTLSITCTEQ